MIEVRMLSNGMVGNGFSYRGFKEGLERAPHMIGCDAGTSDYGPGPLGSGRSTKPAVSVRRDLEIMLQGARSIRVPLVIGSCGVAGAAPHLNQTLQIVQTIARDQSLRFRIALIHTDQDKEELKRAVAAGRVSSMGPFPTLTAERIDQSVHIVAMAGAQPFIDALEGGADVILAGRCTDPAIFASYALRAGIPPGIAWHTARSIDKGSLATTDVAGGSPMLGSATRDGFVVEPTKSGARCTVKTVSALTMYENPDPWSIIQPSGIISAEYSVFTQLDDRRVGVRGSQFASTSQHTVKLEGARQIGYRATFLAGIRDPRLIRNLDDFLLRYRDLVARLANSLGIAADSYQITFRAYGHNAVMGLREPLLGKPSHEIGLLVDVVASTEEHASALLQRASSAGSKLEPVRGTPAGGNFAAPFSPNFVKMGPVFEWSVWHRMQVRHEGDPFKVEFIDV